MALNTFQQNLRLHRTMSSSLGSSRPVTCVARPVKVSRSNCLIVHADASKARGPQPAAAQVTGRTCLWCWVNCCDWQPTRLVKGSCICTPAHWRLAASWPAFDQARLTTSHCNSVQSVLTIRANQGLFSAAPTCAVLTACTHAAAC